MAQRLVAELEAKLVRAQFRVIGLADGGRELIRVDRSGPGGTDNAFIHRGQRELGIRLLSKPYRTVELARKLRAVLEG